MICSPNDGAALAVLLNVGLRASTAAAARERLARLGAEGLSAQELLELVCGSTATPLPETAGSMGRLARMDVDQLRATGASPGAAAAICAAFELGRRVAQEQVPTGLSVRSAAAAYEYLRPRIAHLPHETFVVVLLDVRLRVLRDVRVAEGTGWSCAVHPRDALAPALRESAAAVVFAHNHPSGDPTPSTEDRELTRSLIRACELMGVRAVDHLVVAEQGFASLRELGVFDA